MDWEECVGKNFAKKTSVDKELIKSLTQSSEKRIVSNNRLELDNITAPTKISIAYESLREILEALAIKKGFKIYNHDCFCAFLRDICKDRSSSLDFNRFRIIRNKVNYYGKDVSLEEAKIIIKEIILLRKRIIDNHLKN
jgi:hypothetical protein